MYFDTLEPVSTAYKKDEINMLPLSPCPRTMLLKRNKNLH